MGNPAARLLQLVRSHEPPDVDQGGIIDGALAAFLDFGIRRSSMNEIARRAGLSPATLYRRFAQKSDVVQAVGLREVRRFLAQADASVDHTGSGEDQIVDLSIACMNGIRNNPLLTRLIATEPEIVLPYLTVRGAPVLALGRDYVAEFLSRLQNEDKIPAFDVVPVAEMLARLALSLALTPETSIPLDENAAREFARSHVAVIFRSPAPTP